MTPDDKTGIETLLALMAGSFAVGFWIRHRERLPRTWPQVSGVITTSNTVTKRMQRGQYELLPVIEYQFEYQGRLFNSSHWRFGNFSIGNAESAQAITSRYPKDATVTVFVNPRNPAKSVLETHTSALSWVPFTFGLSFLALTLLVFAATHHH